LPPTTAKALAVRPRQSRQRHSGRGQTKTPGKAPAIAWRAGRRMSGVRRGNEGNVASAERHDAGGGAADVGQMGARWIAKRNSQKETGRALASGMAWGALHHRGSRVVGLARQRVNNRSCSSLGDTGRRRRASGRSETKALADPRAPRPPPLRRDRASRRDGARTIRGFNCRRGTSRVGRFFKQTTITELQHLVSGAC